MSHEKPTQVSVEHVDEIQSRWEGPPWCRTNQLKRWRPCAFFHLMMFEIIRNLLSNQGNNTTHIIFTQLKSFFQKNHLFFTQLNWRFSPDIVTSSARGLAPTNWAAPSSQRSPRRPWASGPWPLGKKNDVALFWGGTTCLEMFLLTHILDWLNISFLEIRCV